MSEPDLDPQQDGDVEQPDQNRDPGADIESEGVPSVADDSTPGHGQVDEPERPTAPTDVPTASTAYGTTEWEQQHPQDLGARLAEEEGEDEGVEDRRDRTQPEEAAIRVDDEPNSAAGEGP